MKNYRTQDLSITALPEGRLDDCFLATHICLHPTDPGCFGGTVCPVDATLGPGPICPDGRTVRPPQTLLCPPDGCGANFSTLPPGGFGRITIRRPEELKQLRTELQKTLDRLDEVDPDDLGRGAREIESVEEAEDLERRLSRALDEVKARKEELGG